LREAPIPGPPIPQDRTVYEALGDQVFRALVGALYQRIESDPRLRPIFPPDLSDGRERQYLFLTQVFGGPPRYTERFGEPRLPLRHRAFPIGRVERDQWLGHMLEAIAEVAIPEPYARFLANYFEQFSLAMINR
jgi:hemoglobin